VGATLAGDAGEARGGHPRGPGLTGLVASLSGAGRGLPAPLLLVAAIVCIQSGAAATTALFDEVGVHGSTFARTLAAGALLLVIARPRLRGRERMDWVAVGVFAPLLAVMMTLFLLAIDRLPLAVVVTLEFLGPLGVALLGSRRLLDLLWVGLAAGGVLLFAGDPTSAGGDWLGVAMALGAGLGWAAYILVAQRVGSRWEGSQGLALSFAGAAVLLAPLGIHEGGTALLRPEVVAIALVVGTIAGALPFALEFAALRRLPARAYGILVSLEPAVAAIVGVIALSQTPRVTEAVAVLLVVAASIGATRSARPPDPL
jgi:inner membrane transporter RhtA